MTPGGKQVILVAAVAENRVIGNGADIPWHVPGEQAEFKQLTMGHTLLMGRTTFESIGRPLPGRTTIVLTRDPGWSHEGVLVAHTVAEAFALADDLDGELMGAGGSQVYEELLPHADLQMLTLIPLQPEGDALYPDYDPTEWLEISRELLAAYTKTVLSRVGPRR